MTVGGGKSGQWTAQQATSYEQGERAGGGGGGGVSDNVSGDVVAWGGGGGDDARRAGGGQCYTQKGADNNGKQQDRALEDGVAA